MSQEAPPPEESDEEHSARHDQLSYILNSLKGGLYWDSIGDYYRGS